MSKVLTKADLVSSLRQQNPQLSGTLASQLTDAFFEEIILALEKNEDVRFSGLGSFRLRNKKARPGRNPKTGVSTLISSRNVVLFQASQKLKAILKGTKAKSKNKGNNTSNKTEKPIKPQRAKVLVEENN